MMKLLAFQVLFFALASCGAAKSKATTTKTSTDSKTETAALSIAIPTQFSINAK